MEQLINGTIWHIDKNALDQQAAGAPATVGVEQTEGTSSAAVATANGSPATLSTTVSSGTTSANTTTASGSPATLGLEVTKGALSADSVTVETSRFGVSARELNLS